VRGLTAGVGREHLGSGHDRAHRTQPGHRAVVICLQLTATVMTLRRDPIQKFEGAAISGLLWVGLRPRD
jgi:hypothetical protein